MLHYLLFKFSWLRDIFHTPRQISNGEHNATVNFLVWVKSGVKTHGGAPLVSKKQHDVFLVAYTHFWHARLRPRVQTASGMRR